MLKRLLIIESSFNQKCESEALVGEEIKEKAPIDRDILQLLGKTFAKLPGVPGAVAALVVGVAGVLVLAGVGVALAAAPD